MDRTSVSYEFSWNEPFIAEYVQLLQEKYPFTLRESAISATDKCETHMFVFDYTGDAEVSDFDLSSDILAGPQDQFELSLTVNYWSSVTPTISFIYSNDLNCMDTGERTTQDLLNINEEYMPPSSSQSGSSRDDDDNDDDPRRCSTCGGDGRINCRTCGGDGEK